MNGAVVSFTARGTCTIDANQAGNGTYRGAPQLQQSFAVYGVATQLAFTTQPSNIVQGDALGVVVVAAKDSSGYPVPISATVDFTIAACGGSFNLGSAGMTNGVASFDSGQRFYTVVSGQTILASTGSLTGTSSSFDIAVNSDLVFSDGFETCRL